MAGLCYPPVKTSWVVDGDEVRRLEGEAQEDEVSTAKVQAQSESQQPTDSSDSLMDYDFLSTKASTSSWGPWATVLQFFLAGFAMSLTACMYPMLPIVSGIIARKGDKHPVWRTVCYTQGLAWTYAVMGALAARGGGWLVTQLQTPVWIILAACLMFLMGLSMLGWFSVRTSSRWSQAIDALIRRLPRERWWGLFLMGVGSALLLGPCITPPLVAALLWVAEQKNLVMGALSFYILGLGLGLPLLLMAVLGQRFLPKAGPWLNDIHRILAWALFGSALLILSSLLARQWMHLLWLFWLVGVVYQFWRPTNFWRKLILIGVALSLLSWRLWPHVGGQEALWGTQAKASAWLEARSEAWPEVLQRAHAEGKKALWVDVTADWCVNCVDFQRWLLQDKVQRYVQEQHIQVIKLDITANTKHDAAWLKKYRLFGPPALLVLDEKGQELKRIIQARHLPKLLPPSSEQAVS